MKRSYEVGREKGTVLEEEGRMLEEGRERGWTERVGRGGWKRGKGRDLEEGVIK